MIDFSCKCTWQYHYCEDNFHFAKKNEENEWFLDDIEKFDCFVTNKKKHEGESIQVLYTVRNYLHQLQTSGEKYEDLYYKA